MRVSESGEAVIATIGSRPLQVEEGGDTNGTYFSMASLTTVSPRIVRMVERAA